MVEVVAASLPLTYPRKALPAVLVAVVWLVERAAAAAAVPLAAAASDGCPPPPAAPAPSR